MDCLGFVLSDVDLLRFRVRESIWELVQIAGAHCHCVSLSTFFAHAHVVLMYVFMFELVLQSLHSFTLDAINCLAQVLSMLLLTDEHSCGPRLPWKSPLPF